MGKGSIWEWYSTLSCRALWESRMVFEEPNKPDTALISVHGFFTKKNVLLWENRSLKYVHRHTRKAIVFLENSLNDQHHVVVKDTMFRDQIFTCIQCVSEQGFSPALCFSLRLWEVLQNPVHYLTCKNNWAVCWHYVDDVILKPNFMVLV